MLPRILALLGIALVGAGVLVALGTPLLAPPAETFAETLPGQVVAAAATATLPGVASTAVPATRTPAPQVTEAPTRIPTPAATPAPTRTPTATPRPTVPAVPTPTLGATRTATPLPVCPTSLPLGPPIVGAVIGTRTPTPTATPGPATCRTATPTPTRTATPRPPTGVLGPGSGSPLLSFASLGGAWLDRGALVKQYQADPNAPPEMRVAVSFPKLIEVGDSESVILVLSRNAEGALVPVLATPNMRALFGTPLPVGTPGVPIEVAHGPNYAAYAAAKLTAPAPADARLYSPLKEEQPLGAGQIEWKWTVTSPASGSKPLHLELEVGFRPRSTPGDEVPARQIWGPVLPLEVQDKSPFSPRELGPNLVKTGSGALLTSFLAWLFRRAGTLLAAARKRPPARRKKRR